MGNEARDADELWASFTLDPRTPAHVDLRASDADRDRIAAVLSEAYADGRLDREELDDRTTTLAATRTLGGLPPLVLDLLPPARSPARSPGAPAPTGALDLTVASAADLQARAHQEWESQRRGALFAFLGPTLICWTVWFATSVESAGFEGNFPWPLIVMAATGLHALRTLTNKQQIVEAELRRLHKKQAKALGRRDEDPA